ncbi:MAG: class I SAM-dependent methyltransferase, partial [Gammaproteobacteria bacterium]|nr:class I SAM-dependent methyltransferase [Gammaproteobacteria bacterium]
RGECEKIPFPDNTFDCVVCLGVISYAESIDKALDELHRVLKPGGVTIVSYRNKYNTICMDPVKLIKHVLTLPFTFFKPEKKVIGRSIPRSEVIADIKNHPFVILKEKPIGFGKLRFAGKVVSDRKLAVKVNNGLDRVLTGLRLNFVYRAMADVHIFILKKPGL